MSSIAPRSGRYSGDNNFVEELSFHADKASQLGSITSGITRGQGVKIRTDGEAIHGTRSGDVLVFGMCRWESVRCGDVVLVRSGRSTLLRRIIRTNITGGQYAFITKTDKSDELHAPIPADAVIGRLTGIERGRKVLPLSTVEGGLLYRFTECGTRSPVEKFLDLLMFVIPSPLRPTTAYRNWAARKKAVR